MLKLIKKKMIEEKMVIMEKNMMKTILTKEEGDSNDSRSFEDECLVDADEKLGNDNENMPPVTGGLHICKE
jgi:hypothetical protein